MSKRLKYGLLLCVLLGVSGGLLYGKSRYILHPISGTSMEEALSSGDRVLVDKKGAVNRYSMIAFSQEGINGMLVKRIVGQPGDQLIVQNQTVWISLSKERPFENNIRMEVSAEVANSLAKETTIPKGRYLVMGDNTDVSQDSRAFGYVKKSAIEGVIKIQFSD